MFEAAVGERSFARFCRGGAATKISCAATELINIIEDISGYDGGSAAPAAAGCHDDAGGVDSVPGSDVVNPEDVDGSSSRGGCRLPAAVNGDSAARRTCNGRSTCDYAMSADGPQLRCSPEGRAGGFYQLANYQQITYECVPGTCALVRRWTFAEIIIIMSLLDVATFPPKWMRGVASFVSVRPSPTL